MADEPFRTDPANWRLCILVVEDNGPAADALCLFLRDAGHDVDAVADGRSALAAAQARPPDVVLLDIGLPGMTGYEVARRLQRLSDPKRPLIVALTGHADDESRRLSEEAGIDLHLAKPVDPRELQAVLERFRSVLAR